MKNILPEIRETHMEGSISIESDLSVGVISGDLGIQIASDGRIWICVDGKSLLRFRLIGNYVCKGSKLSGSNEIQSL